MYYIIWRVSTWPMRPPVLGRNQEGNPVICTPWVPIHLSFNRSAGAAPLCLSGDTRTHQAPGPPPRDNLRGQKSLGPLKMSLEMAHKVIVPQKKIMYRSFLNSGTLIVIISPCGPIHLNGKKFKPLHPNRHFVHSFKGTKGLVIIKLQLSKALYIFSKKCIE